MIGTLTILLRENRRAAEINEILHKNGESILGRMGLPQSDGTGYILSIVFKGEERDFNKLINEIGKFDDLKMGFNKI